MKAILSNRYLVFALRLVLGLIFIIAAIAKLLDVTGFVGTIANYGILSNILTHFYGYLIPWVELFIGCSLVLGTVVKISAALSMPLIVGFMIASGYALANAPGEGCGCFGTFLTLSHQGAITVDVLMLAAAFLLFFSTSQDFLTIEQLLSKLKINSRAVTWSGRIILVGFVVCTAVFVSVKLYQYFDVRSQEIATNMVADTVDVPDSLVSDLLERSLADGKPMLMFFYSSGCYTCEVAQPLVEGIEQEYGGRITPLHLKYIDNLALAESMKIEETPAVLVVSSKTVNGRYVVYRES
ncbi:MAG: conjugal transfer protein TraF, partial [Dehalococcoidales bacterium]|nr:conjugal transfer protein TraF [Dehalococcoidales bacterium]